MVPGPSIEHADVSQQLAEVLGPIARAVGLRPTMSEFNLGESEQDFRVPDGGLHRPPVSGVWHSTAALVVEILSPDDESLQKLPFYAAHDVDEVLLVDPDRAERHLARAEGRRVRSRSSAAGSSSSGRPSSPTGSTGRSASAVARAHEPGLVGEHDRLHAVAHAELPE